MVNIRIYLKESTLNSSIRYTSSESVNIRWRTERVSNDKCSSFAAATLFSWNEKKKKTHKKNSNTSMNFENARYWRTDGKSSVMHIAPRRRIMLFYLNVWTQHFILTASIFHRRRENVLHFCGFRKECMSFFWNFYRWFIRSHINPFIPKKWDCAGVLVRIDNSTTQHSTKTLYPDLICAKIFDVQGNNVKINQYIEIRYVGLLAMQYMRALYQRTTIEITINTSNMCHIRVIHWLISFEVRLWRQH